MIYHIFRILEKYRAIFSKITNNYFKKFEKHKNIIPKYKLYFEIFEKLTNIYFENFKYRKFLNNPHSNF